MAKRTQAAPMMNRGAVDSEQYRSGMVSDQWNEAVRLQCAVRNFLDYPVTMVQALTVARDVLAATGPHVSPQAWRKKLQAEEKERESARLAEQQRISDNAGK